MYKDFFLFLSKQCSFSCHDFFFRRAVALFTNRSYIIVLFWSTIYVQMTANFSIIRTSIKWTSSWLSVYYFRPSINPTARYSVARWANKIFKNLYRFHLRSRPMHGDPPKISLKSVLFFALNAWHSVLSSPVVLQHFAE